MNYPFSDLLDAIRAGRPMHETPRCRHCSNDPTVDAHRCVFIGDVLDLLGIGGQNYRTIRERGLTYYQADRYAVRAGFHPFNIWPAMIEDDPSIPCEGCGEMFDPMNSYQRYCCKPCRVAHRPSRAVLRERAA